MDQREDLWQLIVIPNLMRIRRRCSPNAGEIVSWAWSKGGLTAMEKGEIMAATTGEQRMELFIEKMSANGARTFAMFVDILDEIGREKPVIRDLAQFLRDRFDGKDVQLQ